ncbi:phosphatase PAP2 family protein [Bartonella sp. DGB1]|uniref:phosphatase PAP2 family protein n=1 Tax=Bartonella sp. DGB1 TaxID=3239807 RepID=UPI0035235283
MKLLNDKFSPQLIIILTILFGYSIIAHFYPYLDIWLSQQFFHEDLQNFYLKDNIILIILRLINYFSPILIVGYCVIVIFLHYNTKIPINTIKSYLINYKLAYFILSFYLIITISLIKVLKLYFARSRPRDITLFGGDYPFQAAWEKANYAIIESHSFPSAESAIAMSMILIPWCMPKSQLRTILLFVFSLWIAFVSFNRVLFGAHFLSDIVTSWAIILFFIVVWSKIFNKILALR